VEEALLAEPSPPLDQLAVHDGDLPRRSAEALEADRREGAQRGAEAGQLGWRGFDVGRGHALTISPHVRLHRSRRRSAKTCPHRPAHRWWARGGRSMRLIVNDWLFVAFMAVGAVLIGNAVI
jgi:hypothetical protein